jgi:hypothetical protein
MALSHSASAPGLQAAGSSILSNVTTSLYDKMKSEGTLREYPVAAGHIRPAGKSIKVPLADTAEMDIKPDIHYPAPPTPVKERKFRRMSHGPGEIHVHHGLKDQRLPGEEFRYGVRGVKGVSTEATMKAGLKVGVAEYQQSVAERVYDSTKREPLGRPHFRYSGPLKMLPEGFGNPSGEPMEAKLVLFPVDQPPDTEEMRQQYKKSHNNFLPGERINRNYDFPEETAGENFRYGKSEGKLVEGHGAKMALSTDLTDEGTYKQTRFVQRVCEDFRSVQNTKVGRKVHPKQGASGPPLPPGHRYGIKSTSSAYTARSCILGYYDIEDQLPDQDLGCCTKPGRRNVTMFSRAFGVPSVRTDIPAPPPGSRSVADPVAYGDEPSAAAILNPQRFDNKGISDGEFLIRRPKEELASIVQSCNYDMGEDFESLWERGVELFDDGLPLVSLDALLYLHTQGIHDQVSKRLQASHSAPMLRAA